MPLLAAWIAWIVTVVLAVVTKSTAMIALATTGPVLAVWTWSRAPAAGVLKPRWRWPYRVTCALLLAAGVLGIASGTRAAVLDERHLGNSLLAAIFVGIAILAWRALARPSPVRIAAPAPALYLGCMMFATLGGALDLDLYWSWLAPAYPLGAIWVASVAGAIVSIFAFDAEIPEAQQLA